MPRAKMKNTETASKSKFYAVKKGHKPGIYTTWKDCNHQVHGYRGNQFQGFDCRTEAEQYMNTGPTLLLIPAIPKTKSPTLVKVTRTRATSPRLLRPTEAVDSSGSSESIADDVYQVEYDGASKSNPGPAGAGALVRRPDGSVVCELREGIGSATNNVAEYRAFILGLKGALDRGIYRVRVQGDSKLVCEQVLGRWKVNQPTLAILCKEAQRLIENFSEFSVLHVDREFNSAADQLANEAVSLPETKFVSSFPSARAGKAAAAILGDSTWQQCRDSKAYGAFDLMQSSQLRLACHSYYLGFSPSPVVGAQWLRNIFFPNKAKRALALVARPRVSSSSWTLTRRCFTKMAVSVSFAFLYYWPALSHAIAELQSSSDTPLLSQGFRGFFLVRGRPRAFRGRRGRSCKGRRSSRGALILELRFFKGRAVGWTCFSYLLGSGNRALEVSFCNFEWRKRSEQTLRVWCVKLGLRANWCAMSAAVIRKRSHFEEQQSSPPRSKRLRPALGGSPVRSPSHVDRVSLASVAEVATTSHCDIGPSETEGWVEHLVKEMLNARDLNDAHMRGKLALEAVEKAVASRSTIAVEELQKENADLKEKMQVMLREGHILKRAVAIQHERQQEHEGRTRELQQAKQVIGQYQEQVRSLELNNYSLRMHLRMAQDASSMPGRYHPDVY